jgi:hypothetical protein
MLERREVVSVVAVVAVAGKWKNCFEMVSRLILNCYVFHSSDVVTAMAAAAVAEVLAVEEATRVTRRSGSL